MEWETVGIVLSAASFGEGGAVVTLLTEEHGAHRGLAHGAGSGGARSVWQVGNIVRARWKGRLAGQLGTLRGETLQVPSSSLFDAPLAMLVLASTCAVAAGALPERAPYPRTYVGLVNLLAALARRCADVPAVVRWETVLLEELGYGLDLSRCAVTGATDGLRFVSPRSGCAVSDVGAGAWRDKLLRLPPYLLDNDADGGATPSDCCDGLMLTGYFLERDAFGHRHQSLPALRHRLLDMVVRRNGP